MHGAPPRLEATTATSDARHFVSHGIPAVCFGPRAQEIHGIDVTRVNEYLRGLWLQNAMYVAQRDVDGEEEDNDDVMDVDEGGEFNSAMDVDEEQR